MSISVELADEPAGRSDACRRRCRDAKAFIDQARLSSIRIDALRYNSTTEAAKKRYGSNKPRAPECYGCNSMSMN
jgi:hypothetical protein